MRVNTYSLRQDSKLGDRSRILATVDRVLFATPELKLSEKRIYEVEFLKSVSHSTESSLRRLINKNFSNYSDWEENQENTAPQEGEKAPENGVLWCAEEDDFDLLWL